MAAAHPTPVPPPTQVGSPIAATAVLLATLLLAASTAVAVGPTVVTSVMVRPEQEGTTIVEIAANGPGLPYAYRQYHDLEGSPRGVLRLRGILEPYAVDTIPVGDCNLVRVRVGHHPELQPPELHVVLDLASPEVTVLDVARNGNRLRFYFGRPAALPDAAAGETRPGPLATPPPTAPPAPTPSPTQPPPTSTPTSPPRPSPPPRPTRSPTPRIVSRSPTPASAASARALYRNPRPTARSTSDDALTASTVTEIVIAHREDGSTLLRVTADQPFLRHSVIDYRDPDDPSRHALLLFGVTLPGAPEQIEVDDPCLRSIEVRPGERGRPAEVTLILVLASARVHTARVATLGAHLAVVLEPPPTE